MRHDFPRRGTCLVYKQKRTKRKSRINRLHLQRSTGCPLRKKDKEEKQDQQVASAEIDRLSSRLEEEFTMITDIPLGVR